LKADEVARYLRENPTFFETHADMLADISIPHPHGGRAILSPTGKLLALREKSRALESRLTELLQIGEENDAIGEKMHRLSLALLAAPDWQSLMNALYFQTCGRTSRCPTQRFGSGAQSAAHRKGRWVRLSFAAWASSLKRYAASLSQPFCGPSSDAEAAAWFGEGASHVRSVAHMGPRDRDCFGMLALGSEDVFALLSRDGHAFISSAWAIWRARRC